MLSSSSWAQLLLDVSDCKTIDDGVLHTYILECPKETRVHSKEEPSVEDAIGDFDNDGVLHNPTEKTYRLPDMGAFVAYFPATGDVATGLSVELYDRRHRRGMFNWFKYDLFISEQRLGIAIGRKIFPVVDITISVVYSRDFDRDEDVWGFSASLIKF